MKFDIETPYNITKYTKTEDKCIALVFTTHNLRNKIKKKIKIRKTHLVVNTNNNTTANPSIKRKHRFNETFGSLIAVYYRFQ